MFRELTRKKQELSREECVRILQTEKRGVLSVNGEDGYPYGTPMNHWYNAEDGKLYFHCGRAGYRLDALQRSGKASFCVYDGGCCEQGDWALRFKSVILFGEIEIIDDPARVVEITAKLCRKFTQDEAYIKAEIAQHAHRTLLLAMTPLHICGKSVKES